ncbi:MAG: deoxyribonuclease IV [Phycisphaeraceae bacterium]|nr:deoxyribonuclease IV [Phycisphaeraceae bacterium]
MFGSHLSIAGSMSNALREAEGLGLDCVQVFTKNQQQWTPPPLNEGVVTEWRGEVKRLGWGEEPARLVSHASYLINLASPDDVLWKKSIDTMQEEIERCERLGIGRLVHHPGAHTTSTLEEGLGRIAAAYRELFRRTKGYATVSCLENTAGGGSTIGRGFEDLARLRGMIVEATGEAGRVGFCFDTCHAHAAGYDMAGRAKAGAVLDEFDRVCGIENLRVLHLNDSKGACGSRLDRHEHIGKGTIGEEGFAGVLGRTELAALPMILETPKGEADKRVAWDTVNLRVLRKAAGVREVAGKKAATAPVSGAKGGAGVRKSRAVGR